MFHQKTSARILVAFLALVIAALGLAAQTNPPAAQPHLIVVSIDGLMPAAYLHPDQYNLKIPTLRRLMREGSYAAGVESVIPSVTYPSHATLVTGVSPAVHGIYANPTFTDPESGAREYFWNASRFRARTLWDVARDAGLETAAVGWPTTVGGALDYQIAEVWDVREEGGKSGSDFRFAAPYSTPGLVEAVEREFGRSTSKPLDEARTDAAIYILRHDRPQLLLLHIYDVDYAQHSFGPMSPEALAAIETADKQVDRLMEAAGQAGILDVTTFVVVSDHGFLPIRFDVNLGRLLRDRGLVRRAGDGKIRKWTVAPLEMGGAAYLFFHRPGNDSDLHKLYAALAPSVSRGEIGAVFSPAATREMTGVDGAVFIEAGALHRFRDGWSRAVVVEPSGRRGYHGFLPYHAGMDASFIAAGRGIRPGVRLPVIRMTSIAPTLASLLGLKLPQADPNQTLATILEQ